MIKNIKKFKNWENWNERVCKLENKYNKKIEIFRDYKRDRWILKIGDLKIYGKILDVLVYRIENLF